MANNWRSTIGSLPISSHLEEICRGIREHSISILEAPPGTGKTTVLPLALMEEPWLSGRSILILQPRRIAARNVALRMSELLKEPVGRSIGYSVRLESKRSSATRVEVITEGLLTRRLIADPELSGVGMVIFDEFHERSIHADLGLALTLESLSAIRPDLKVLVMSATLGESLPQRFLANSWRYSFEGTPHAVLINYEPGDPRAKLWERAATAIKAGLQRFEGDILAFLPGAFEIQRTQELLERARLDAIITPLFGDLPYSEQSRAIQPDPQGRRKIVLATNLAETSLTIEGIRVVVDAGLQKVSRVSASGFSTLSTEPISRDAADQRTGRAGRTAPGTCIRLWSEQDHRGRRAFREAEVLRSDLTPTLLDLAAWGVKNFESFNWITPPPQSALESSRNTLVALSALSIEGAITPYGKTLASFGAHPRLAALAVMARERGLEQVAAKLIAILEERDLFAGNTPSANIILRLDAISPLKAPHGASRRILELSERWLERILALPKPTKKPSAQISSEEAPAILLALAFPERVGRRREPGSHRYLLASGKGAALRAGDPLASSEYLATCTLQDAGDDVSIRLAAPLRAELLKGPLASLIGTTHEVSVDDKTGTLISQRLELLGALIISSRIEQSVSEEEISDAFSRWLQSDSGYQRVPFSDSSRRLQARVMWARALSPSSSLPDLSEKALRSTIGEWLLPHAPYPPTLRALTETLTNQALAASLSWAQKKELDDLAPSSITLPSGKTRPIIYTETAPPILEARIQDLFGMTETPRIGRLRVAATIHLLSPANRPVQVTQDLSSFWKHGYPEVRKELRGRYPKHKWPEDPLA